MGDDGPAVLMAGPYRPREQLERFPKTFITQVGYVEYETQTLHLRNQFLAAGRETTTGIGAVRINSRAVVRGPDRPQSIGPGTLKMIQCDQRVCPFQG